MTTHPLLSISKLTAGYSSQPVLRNVTLEVEADSVFALIGPNGHGKTTLLRCLSGIIAAQTGQILFAGESLEKLRVDERVQHGLIHVPQGDQLFGGMCVEENLSMGAYLRRDRTAINHSLDEVYTFFPRLAERRQQMANSLSGGERRMAGIGRGLMAAGKCLMIDEPSLGLAPLIIEQIYEGLKKLSQTGKAFLIIEENPMRIADIADKIGLMDAGEIVWAGRAEELASENKIMQTYFGTH